MKIRIFLLRGLGLFTLFNSLHAKVQSKAEHESYSEQELADKDAEIQEAAMRVSFGLAGTAGAVATTPPPANVLVGAAGGYAVYESYRKGADAEMDLADMRAHNNRVADAKDRNREFVRDQRHVENALRSKTLRAFSSRKWQS